MIESQADEYAEKEGGDVLVLPEHCGGNIARTRKHIVNQASPGEWVVMLDDDVTEVGYFDRAEGGSSKSGQQPYSRDQFHDFLDVGCQMADDMGTGLWGVNLQSDPKFYREYAPFSTQSPVLGPFTVQKAGTGLVYDERLFLNEDYDLFLQAIHRFRRVLRFNRNYYQCDHQKLAGGCVSTRTMTEEHRQADLMVRKWGNQAVKYKFPDVNPRVRSPIPGI